MEESEQETIRKAMSLMGRKRTPAQTEARRENAAKAAAATAGKPMSEEHKAKLRAAQRARRDREKQAQGG
ncbi:MAG: hypothetical protein JWN14_3004, partial [Chthonomonadales bacterium]|nr:hypothetical protein [Chthonomonadales bacterium]